MNRQGVRATDGTNLSVRRHGDPNAEVSVIFVHGWTLGAELFDGVIGHLLAATAGEVNLISYDGRGHGRTLAGSPGNATLEQLADDLRSVVDACAPQGSVILVGHSMGGMTLLAFAERHRDLLDMRVTGAAFVCTSSGRMWEPVKRLPGFYSLAPRVLTLGSPTMIRKSFLTRFGLRHGLFGGVARTEDLNSTIDQMRSVDPAAYAELGVSMMHHDRAHVLPAFDRIPTVVFAGTRDRLTPLRHGRRIAAGIDRALLVVEAGAGHMVPIERAESLTRELAVLVDESAALQTASQSA